jgi:RNA polymerase sigma-70 factor (ECF subfamily)
MNCLMNAWHRHEAELHGWLQRRLGNRSDADDMLQDLFLKCIRQQDRFCELENARAWLFEVARNALIDRLRLTREQVELPADLATVVEEVAPVDSLAACLPRVLSELSAEDREAITLCDLEGMSQQAYAELKSISLPGAKSRIQRARKRMRAQLASACQVRFDAAGLVSDFIPRPPLR